MNRRSFLRTTGVSASGLALSGCDAFDTLLRGDSMVRDVLESAENLTYRVQRLLVGDALAREFSEADIRQPQRPNGSTSPQTEDYLSLARQGFATYKLPVTGLVERPLSLSLENVRAMAPRTQITRHDCVEGWSCIAKWTGTPLAAVLAEARLRPEARYVVFQCFDVMERGLSGVVYYYESIDMIDALHPQTILAYGLNGKALPIENGAPLRLRVERQLGYKMAKYIRGIEVTDTLKPFGLGKGGYWEDRGYEWYAGI
jgi:DMSO/TMAO reductase YedYZ molybdopterin-dependent catalytic subunit